MYQHNRPITFYSVLGAYAYDNTLFDNFFLHEDILVYKEALIEYIIYENSDMPLHVVNLDLLKIKIGLWCTKNNENWLRIYEALYQKYNPLHNFDRYEETEDSSTGEGERNTTNTGNGTNNTTVNLKHDGDKTDTFNTSDATSYGKTESTSKNFGETETHTGTETNAHENTAFNAGVSLTARDTITKNLSDTLDHNESGTLTSGGTDTLRKTGTITTNDDFTEDTTTTGRTTASETGNETYSDDKTIIHDGHLWGNIGVTTSQKMLQDEIDVRFTNNFYDILSAQFRLEFCVLIY